MTHPDTVDILAPHSLLRHSDLRTTLRQNYRFTEEELRWIRRQAFKLTARFETKVSQNTVLRVSLKLLRGACSKNSKSNPLTKAVSKIKK